MFGHDVKGLFEEALIPNPEEDAKKEERAREKRRYDGASLDPNVMQRTPHWMAENPKWLQRKVLEDEGYVTKEVKPTEKLIEVELTEEEIERAEKHWEQFGGNPHCTVHDRFGSDTDSDTPLPKQVTKKRRRMQHFATDDPDTGNSPPPAPPASRSGLLDEGPPPVAAPAAAPSDQLYNFCQNKNCQSYKVFDLSVQQKWQGECCSGRHQFQPQVAQDDEEEGEAEGADEEEDWDITDGDLAELMQHDPDTANILKNIKNVYSDIPVEVLPSESAAIAAALSILSSESILKLEAFDEEEYEDEEEEEEEEEENAFVEAVQFIKNCHFLLEGIKTALTTDDGTVHILEPFTSLFARLIEVVESFKAEADIKLAKKYTFCVLANDSPMQVDEEKDGEDTMVEQSARKSETTDTPMTEGGDKEAKEGVKEKEAEPMEKEEDEKDEESVSEEEVEVDRERFEVFKSEALEVIRVIRREHNIHKNAHRPVKKPVIIDGEKYDL